MTTSPPAQLGLFPSAPPSLPFRATWWLSTPAFTCLVACDAAAQIVETAPRLRIWRGQPLARLRMWCWTRWRTACRWERLPDRREVTSP